MDYSSNSGHCSPWWLPLATLRDPAVSELAAALLCPPLLRLGDLSPRTSLWNRQTIIDWLIGLDQHPDALHQALCKPAHRLGLHFERLFAFYLLHQTDGKALIRNLQVKADKGITAGEFDFLYSAGAKAARSEKAYCHLEVALKFFLRPAVGRQHRQWVGPNPRDRLDLKRRHMLRKQLRLSRTAAGITTLARYQVGQPARGCLLKGCLCYPWKEFLGEVIAPWHASEEHWKGWWLEQDQIAGLQQAHLRYRVLARRDWLSLACDDEAQLSDWLGFRRRIAEYRGTQPLLISRLRELNSRWLEQDRGFIVPKGWLTSPAVLQPAP